MMQWGWDTGEHTKSQPHLHVRSFENEMHIKPDDLLPLLRQNHKVLALFVGTGPLQESVLFQFRNAKDMLVHKGYSCVVVDATIPNQILDSRISVIRVPQLRVFRKGQLNRQLTGVIDISEYFAAKLQR